MHWVAVRLIPDNWTLGFGGIARWYNKNGCFIYQEESFVYQKSRYCIGYGYRPIGRIIGFQAEGGQDYYIIEMETDEPPNDQEYFDRYMKTGIVTGKPERKKETQRHFKWNIEHQFREIKM